jgi:plasmid stability protein
MAVLTVRNLSNEVHRALRMRAAKNNRSTESEVREILASAVVPERRILMGTAMAAMARGNGLTNEDAIALEKVIEEARDKMPAEPVMFK